jgi:hypothetical protein
MRAMKTFDLKKLPILLSAVLLCFSARSQTFQVTTTADSGPGSLREAMMNANPAGGGTILFTNVSGVINLQSALPDISDNLSILGNGQTNLAINSYRTNRIFNVLAGATCNISDLTLQGGPPLVETIFPFASGSITVFNAGALSISNCFLHDFGSGNYAAGGGGAIYSKGSSLVLNNVVLSNTAAYGMAAFSVSNVRATNCLFIGNIAGDVPPVSVGGESVFSDTTITQNKAVFATGGGGISAGGNLTLLNCSVTNNYGDHDTGGIHFSGNSLTISNCLINNNYTGGRFGGINSGATNILILNSTISANRADSYSGMTLGGNSTVSGCTISSNLNEATHFGGGVAASGTLNMTNCTISGNLARYHPSVGVFCEYGSTRAVNCTIAFNGIGVDNSVYTSNTFYALNTIIANNGTGPTNGDFFGTLTSQGHNLIGNLNTNMTIVGSANGDIYGVDPLLGSLQNNGGPTLTHALLTGSPAIDAGTRTGAPLTDQRGVVRHFGISVDIGAFESEYRMLTNEVRITAISLVDATNIHLRVQGPPGSIRTIQASTNLLDWENVFISSNGVTGIWDFVDQDAANHPNRFYRALINNK